MIGNIRVTAAAQTGGTLGGEGGGGKIHGPEHHSGGGEVDSAVGHDAEDFSPVQGEIARVHGHAKPRDAGEAAGASAVAKAGAGVEVMAAAGASANGGTLAVAAVGKRVTAGTDDEMRVHRALRRVNRSG
jgi:hypothetical protein